MKRLLYAFSLILILACSNDEGNRNPYIQEVGFRFEMNLNLPLYSPLTNIGNAIYVGNQGVGVRGAFVMKSGFDQYIAWEASCPNHPPNNCSTMDLNGQTVTCSCEGYEYNLFNGQQANRPDDGQQYYDLLFYQTSFNNNTVVISN
ncbi:hypothetical protein [Eudoraea chungangensis]|uniref:hypothetical protein n=1 Tax=Eudoraea chungangensis TaxID=1481905 RepID=UPI0023EDACCF|nr:hypothetical protein [Eudoraea chungangensis]